MLITKKRTNSKFRIYMFYASFFSCSKRRPNSSLFYCWLRLFLPRCLFVFDLIFSQKERNKRFLRGAAILRQLVDFFVHKLHLQPTAQKFVLNSKNSIRNKEKVEASFLDLDKIQNFMIYKNTATSTRCDGFRYLLGYIYINIFIAMCSLKSTILTICIYIYIWTLPDSIIISKKK